VTTAGQLRNRQTAMCASPRSASASTNEIRTLTISVLGCVRLMLSIPRPATAMPPRGLRRGGLELSVQGRGSLNDSGTSPESSRTPLVRAAPRHPHDNRPPRPPDASPRCACRRGCRGCRNEDWTIGGTLEPTVTTDNAHPEGDGGDPAKARPYSAIARASDQALRGDGNDRAVRNVAIRGKTHTALLAYRLDNSYLSGNSTLNDRNRTTGQGRL